MRRIPRRRAHHRKDLRRDQSDLAFLALYLYHHPGSRGAQARRALCRHRGQQFRAGIYCKYFIEEIMEGMSYAGRYWIRLGQGWCLTAEGMGLVQLEAEAPAS